MKARRKGTDNPFKTVERIQLEDEDILYNIDVIEFEQDVTTTHDTLSTELKPYNQIDEEKHWQEVRERAAIAAMQGTIGILSNSDRYAFNDIVAMGFKGDKKTYPNEISQFAVACADALIEELKGKETKDEKNTIDKIEPKFYEGNFIVDIFSYVWKIEGILNQFYVLEGVEGGESRPTIEWVDKTFHLWTIKDAKDGDVLISRSPFIYGKQCPYGGLNWYNDKFIKASNFMFADDPVHPATKKQRNFLFQKMKEAEYEWDTEYFKLVLKSQKR